MNQLPLVSAAGFVPVYQQPSTETFDYDVRFNAKLLEPLQHCWAHDTGIPHTALSEDRTFWELGGNSLTALQMLAQLRKDLGVNVEAAEFFALPTFANLQHLASIRRAR